jgi:nicotinamide-nucleotide amidase
MGIEREIARRSKALAAALDGTAIRIATAESCTGGQLSALLARDPALGPHLERGFVVYSADAKCELLGVERADAERCGAVNPEAAEAMAAGAVSNSRADVGVAITGFCGPQEEDEEVGLVYVARADGEGRRALHECHFGDPGRDAVLDHAVATGLAILIEAVEQRVSGLSLTFPANAGG